MGIKKIKIVEKNIRAYGYAYPDFNLIEISPNQTDKQYMDTLIHELLHLLYPEDSESKVSKNAATIRYHLWQKGFRRVK
jgi:Zn-dependent peptidase ImmA (M78 family)